MIYNKISSKVIVARVQNSFDINSTDWIARSPVWINDMLADTYLYSGLETLTKDIKVVDSSFQLPCDLKLIVAIIYQNTALIRVDKNKLEFESNLKFKYNSVNSYEILNNSYAVTSFDEGDIKVIYKSAPVEYDDNMAVYFPIIPDDNNFKVALEWYLLQRILQRGYTVKGYSLEKNNPFVNPAMAYQASRKKAMNSVNRLDKDERDKISRTLKNFVYIEDPSNLNNL